MKKIILKILTLGVFIVSCINTTSKTPRYIKNDTKKGQELEVDHSAKLFTSQKYKTNKSQLRFKPLSVLGTLLTTYLLGSIFVDPVNSLELDEEKNFNDDYKNNIIYNKHKSRNLLADHEEVFLKKYSIDTPIFDLLIDTYPYEKYREFYSDITVCNDSSIVVSESRSIFNFEEEDFEGLSAFSISYIKKLNRNGTINWAKYLFQEESSSIIQIKRTVKVNSEDEDIIFAGDSSEGIVLGRMKSSNGNIVWLKEITGITTIEEDIAYKAEDLINTNDGKFALLGFVDSDFVNQLRRRLAPAPIGPYSFLSKFDGNGDIEWSTQSMPMSHHYDMDLPKNLIQLTDGCYITGGTREDVCFSKYYENGTHAYTKEIFINGTEVLRYSFLNNIVFDTFQRLVALRDSKFALIGTSDYLRSDFTSPQPFITLINSNGEIDWFKIFNISSNKTEFKLTPNSMAITKNYNNEIILGMNNMEANNIIIKRRRMGSSKLSIEKKINYNPVNERRRLNDHILNTLDQGITTYMKINTDCDILFSKVIPEEKSLTHLVSLDTTRDSHILMFGFNNSFDQRFLLKTDPEGEINECSEDYFLEPIYLNASTENVEVDVNSTELIAENISADVYPLNISCTFDPCTPTSSPTNLPTEEPTDFPTHFPSERPTTQPTNLITTEEAIELPTIAPQPTQSEEPTIQSDREESGTTDDGFSEIGLGVLVGLSAIVLIFIVLCIIYCIPYIKNPIV